MILLTLRVRRTSISSKGVQRPIIKYQTATSSLRATAATASLIEPFLASNFLPHLAEGCPERKIACADSINKQRKSRRPWPPIPPLHSSWPLLSKAGLSPTYLTSL